MQGVCGVCVGGVCMVCKVKLSHDIVVKALPDHGDMVKALPNHGDASWWYGKSFTRPW